MKTYCAPQAQVICFDNDYVVNTHSSAGSVAMAGYQAMQQNTEAE